MPSLRACDFANRPSISKYADDAGLEGLSDPEVLELAAREHRVLVSHDKSTMPVHFAGRVRSGLRSPGVLLALPSASVGEIIESLVIIWSASNDKEWSDQIHSMARNCSYFPSGRHGLAKTCFGFPVAAHRSSIRSDGGRHGDGPMKVDVPANRHPVVRSAVMYTAQSLRLSSQQPGGTPIALTTSLHGVRHVLGKRLPYVLVK